jgi:hypothetical protein
MSKASKASASKHLYPLFLLLCAVTMPSYGQVSAQSNAGLTHQVTFTTTASYGVNSSTSSTPGVVATSEATLGVLPSSALNNSIDCSQTTCKAVFTSNSYGESSTNATALINGLKNANLLVIDPSTTSFTTNVDIQKDSSDGLRQGSASSGFSATLTAGAQEVKSSFSNSFQQVF